MKIYLLLGITVDNTPEVILIDDLSTLTDKLKEIRDNDGLATFAGNKKDRHYKELQIISNNKKIKKCKIVSSNGDN